MQALRVGVVGCGNISDIYFACCKRFESIVITACSDLIPAAAEMKAREHDIKRVLTPEALIEDPDIDIVLNLTVPKAHAPIAEKALEAGKHVYNEKPVALTREEGKGLLDRAQAKGVRLGCAPDTVLGAGIQTARKMIDDGWIGEVVSATAFMQCHGHEGWHPSPEFYYEMGGGPMFDMGPYYLTALVTLMGPITHVSAVTRSAFPTRLITSMPKKGKAIPVETSTHLTGLVEFSNKAVCTLITSFDVWCDSLPPIEIHGTEGSLSVPDPNGFGGEVKIYRPGYKEWKPVPFSHIYSEQSRGVGLADMASAIQLKREHRANGRLAYHVLDVMHAFLDAGNVNARVAVDSVCERPAPMATALRDGQTDR